jgi:hypothetical protein
MSRSPADPVTLLTFGHGVAGQEQLTDLLRGAAVRAVVDVRTAPGSRHNPDAGRAALGEWLPAAGIDYRWERRLGGFRKAAPNSPDVFWENASFRGYAGHTRDPGFLTAMAVVAAPSGADPYRGHVRGVGVVALPSPDHPDFAVLARHTRVLHLAHNGRLTEHQPAPGAGCARTDSWSTTGCDPAPRDRRARAHPTPGTGGSAPSRSGGRPPAAP